MDYFNWLAQRNFRVDERFDVWDFSDLSCDQHLALFEHPIDEFSLNLSSLPDEIYIASHIKLHTRNDFLPVYHTDRIYLCPLTPIQWKQTVEPLIRDNKLRKYSINSPLAGAMTEKLESLTHDLDVTDISHGNNVKCKLYHYVISKNMLVIYLRKSELWVERPNERYAFLFTVVMPWSDGYLNTCNMGYKPGYPDPITFKKYSATMGRLFARPLSCVLYVIGESSELVLCPMCMQYVCDYYHKCVRTDSGNTELINRLREKNCPFYMICHRFKYNFHSHKCLEHLNLNCDKYKIFNNMLYEKIKDPNCMSFASMLCVREYVYPSLAVYDECLH